MKVMVDFELFANIPVADEKRVRILEKKSGIPDTAIKKDNDIIHK